MKKVVFLIVLAIISLSLEAQIMGSMRNVTATTVNIDSIRYNQDSVPTVFFKIVRTIQDTTQQMQSSMSELNRSLRIGADRLRFAEQSIKSQIQFLQDSVSDENSRKYVIQQIYQQSNQAETFRTEYEMLRETKRAFLKVIK